MRKPSDLGFEDNDFILPELKIITHFIPVDYKPEYKLFFDGLKGIQDRGKIRRETINPKIDEALGIIDKNSQWIIWCGLNEESSRIVKKIEVAVEIKGSDSPEYKAEMIEAF